MADETPAGGEDFASRYIAQRNARTKGAATPSPYYATPQNNLMEEVISAIGSDIGLSLRAIPHLPMAVTEGWWDPNVSEEERRLRRRAVADGVMLLTSAGFGRIGTALARGAAPPLIKTLMGGAFRAGAVAGGVENVIFDQIDAQPDDRNPLLAFGTGALLGGALGKAGHLATSRIGKKAKAVLPILEEGKGPKGPGTAPGVRGPKGPKGPPPADIASAESVLADLHRDPDDPFYHFLWNTVDPEVQKYTKRKFEGEVAESYIGRHSGADIVAEASEDLQGNPASDVKPASTGGRNRAKRLYWDEIKEHEGLRGVVNREARNEALGRIVGRKVLSINELTADELKTVTQRLRETRGPAVVAEGPRIAKSPALITRETLPDKKPYVFEFTDELHRDLYQLPARKALKQEELAVMGERLGVPYDEVPGLADTYRDMVQWNAARSGKGFQQIPSWAQMKDVAPEYIESLRSQAVSAPLEKRAQTVRTPTNGDITQVQQIRKEGAKAARYRTSTETPTVRLNTMGQPVKVRRNAPTEAEIKAATKAERQTGTPAKVQTSKGGATAGLQQVDRRMGSMLNRPEVARLRLGSRAPLLAALKRANQTGDPGEIVKAVSEYVYKGLKAGELPARVYGEAGAAERSRLAERLTSVLRAGFNVRGGQLERAVPKSVSRPARKPISHRILSQVQREAGVKVPRSRLEREGSRRLAREGFFTNLTPEQIAERNPLARKIKGQMERPPAPTQLRKEAIRRSAEVKNQPGYTEPPEPGSPQQRETATMKAVAKAQEAGRLPNEVLGVRRTDTGEVKLDRKATRHGMVNASALLGLTKEQIDQLFLEGKLEFGALQNGKWVPWKGMTNMVKAAAEFSAPGEKKINFNDPTVKAFVKAVREGHEALAQASEPFLRKKGIDPDDLRSRIKNR